MDLYGLHLNNVGATTEMALAVLALILSFVFAALYDRNASREKKRLLRWEFAGSLVFMALFAAGSVILLAPSVSLRDYESVAWGSLGLAAACVGGIYFVTVRSYWLWIAPLVWLAAANAVVGFAVWVSIADPAWARRFTWGMYVSAYALAPATLGCLAVAVIVAYHKVS